MPQAARIEATEAPRWLAWVASARAGSRPAFASLHDHFCGMVHAILIARVPAGDAADLVQDVFLSALSKLSTLEDDSAFRGWLIQIARSRAAMHLRDRKSHDPIDDELGPRAPSGPEAATDARRVVKAIQALPEAYRETVAMRLVEGMTGPEIAERTGLTAGSVRVNLHRGIELLKESLGIDE